MGATGKNNAVRLFAEIAKTPLEHETGLMGRKSLSEHTGMLFDFGHEKELSFWMANTYIPLQIAFIKSNGKIGEIKSMVPLSTRPIRSLGKYRYALEVNDGWFNANGIRINSQAALPGNMMSVEQNPTPMTQPPIQPQLQVQPKPSEMVQRQILEQAIQAHLDVEITYQEEGSKKIVTKRVSPQEIKRAENGHKYMIAFDQKEPTAGSGLRSFILGSRNLLSINNPYSVDREQIFNPQQVAI